MTHKGKSVEESKETTAAACSSSSRKCWAQETKSPWKWNVLIFSLCERMERRRTVTKGNGGEGAGGKRSSESLQLFIGRIYQLFMCAFTARKSKHDHELYRCRRAGARRKTTDCWGMLPREHPLLQLLMLNFNPSTFTFTRFLDFGPFFSVNLSQNDQKYIKKIWFLKHQSSCKTHRVLNSNSWCRHGNSTMVQFRHCFPVLLWFCFSV